MILCKMTAECKQHRAHNIRLLRISYASHICRKSCFAVSETFLSGWYTRASFLKLQQAEAWSKRQTPVGLHVV